MKRYLVLTAIASLAALSCGSKASVTVTGIIVQPELTVAAGVLTKQLTGGFGLHLALGNLAPDPADVALSGATFALVRSADQSSLLVLRTAVAPAGPIHLEPGAAADVQFTVTNGTSPPGQEITQQQTDSICASGGAEIVGTVGNADVGPGTVRSVSLMVGGPGCSP